MFRCAYGREKLRPLSACEDAVTNEVFVHSHHKHSESQPPATAVIMHERVAGLDVAGQRLPWRKNGVMVRGGAN